MRLSLFAYDIFFCFLNNIFYFEMRIKLYYMYGEKAGCFMHTIIYDVDERMLLSRFNGHFLSAYTIVFVLNRVHILCCANKLWKQNLLFCLFQKYVNMYHRFIVLLRHTKINYCVVYTSAWICISLLYKEENINSIPNMVHVPHAPRIVPLPSRRHAKRLNAPETA